jgi:peptidoglycan/LPS O-acetylase OafA/YrhL
VSFQDRSFPTLNAVRAAGAIMVVLTHAAFNTGQINHGWTGAVLSRLDFGVTLFFVLSGFLLSRPYFLTRELGRDWPSTRHFYWKRALRILPIYWVIVVVALVLDPANDGASWRVWASHLTLTQLYRHDLLASSLTQMWSLCTEVAFYLLLPALCHLLVRGAMKDGRPHLPSIYLRAAVLAALGVVWQAVVAQIPGHEGHYAQWLPGYLPWFLVGMCYAALSASLAARPREHPVDRLARDLPGCWILATAVFAIACTPIAGPRLLLTPTGWEAALKVVLYTIAGAFYLLPLVFGPEREGRVRAQLSGPIPFWLGDISYGVFALHMFFLNLVFRVLDIQIFTGHFITVALATLLLTVPVATLSFYWFERPIMRAKNIRFFARMDAGARPVRATVR